MLQTRLSCRTLRDWLPTALFCVGAIALPDSVAWGYSVEVDAAVIGQGYQLSTADGGSAARVDRRRLTTYLGLTLGDLGRKDRDGRPAVRDQINVTLQLRLDSEFGDFLCNIGRVSNGSPLACIDPTPGSGATGVRTDPELTNHRTELLLAYAEGQSLAGFIDVRLGRQILWEMFDMRGLDGGWLSLRTPIHLALEAFGGVAQNGALVIDPSLYVLDGTSRDPRLLPDDKKQQFLALQPLVGATLRTTGLRDVQARLSYRQTFSATQDRSAPGCIDGAACAPETGRIEEKLSGTLHGRLLGGKLHGFGGLRYDLLNGRFDDGQAGVRVLPSRGHAIGAEYRYSAPTWDGDSIWNVFATEPYHHAQASYDGSVKTGAAPSQTEVAWHARGFARFYRSTTSDGTTQLAPAYGGDVGVRYRRARGFVRLDGYCDGGYGGTRAGADLSGRLLLHRDTIGIEGRVYYMYWADDQRARNSSHGVALQGGVRWAIHRGALLQLLVEDSIDRFYNSQLRFLAQLDLSFALGPRGGGRPPVGNLSAGFGEFPAPGLMPGFYQ